jgi:hypothetical protein
MSHPSWKPVWMIYCRDGQSERIFTASICTRVACGI